MHHVSLKSSNPHPPSMANQSQDNRQDLLKQELTKWEAFHRLAGNPDYQLVLKPLLESVHNKWPDPAQDNFERKYSIEYGRATAYMEVLGFFEMAEKMITNIRKQMAEPEKNYAV